MANLLSPFSSPSTSTPLVLTLSWEDWAEVVEADHYFNANSYFFIHGNEDGVTVEVTANTFKQAFDYYVKGKHDRYLLTTEQATYVTKSLAFPKADDWYDEHLHSSYQEAVDLPYYYSYKGGLVVYSSYQGDNGFWAAESLN